MDYEWKVKVPPMEKHNFIRNKARDLFKLQNLKIYDVIKKGFQSHLRDAFAHSDFSFQWHKGSARLTDFNTTLDAFIDIIEVVTDYVNTKIENLKTQWDKIIDKIDIDDLYSNSKVPKERDIYKRARDGSIKSLVT